MAFASIPLAAPHRTLLRDGLLAGGLWLGSFLLLKVGHADADVRFFWNTLLACAIFVYGLSGYALVPQSLGKPYAAGRYLLRVGGLLLALLAPVSLWVMAASQDEDTVLLFAALNAAFQLLVTAPIAWHVFRRRGRAQAELTGLRTELGQSAAKLELLRAQVNPHFLFNALNTLYGLALQGDGARTADGIQRLGDMMRFMLYENQQPHILLAQESDYLRHYLALQTLRTAPSAHLVVEADLDEGPEDWVIAPMLLIPFVENAFKHGINLHKPSWIRVVLRCEAGTLRLEVRNSNHAEPAATGPSGLGLANVRQRLELLYPGRHELRIEPGPAEYLVHLMLPLERPQPADLLTEESLEA